MHTNVRDKYPALDLWFCRNDNHHIMLSSLNDIDAGRQAGCCSPARAGAYAGQYLPGCSSAAVCSMRG